ncbi:hypothetical protein [Fibrobacter sp. UWB5]|uniref:hypothetical protein n=1 Tax=Fibrobacter sp. UWB5 TaxID=1964360 RepID=UPI000B51FFC1|nr:hypothetical protein [Fibrobacter sp. UWB5]OWV10600.1 hypothetical protein B7989_11355 [Fibrobacter sp. UWB5]
MNKKILTTLAALSFAFYLGACGDDNSSSASIECLDNENCLDEDLSSSSEDDGSSSSAKSGKDKSSSSVKKDGKSSSSEKATSSSSEKKDEKSSSSAKDEKSSSSEKKDEKSSSSEKVESSSSEAPVSSSSAEPESSSSVELKVTYLSETPNAADLEVSGDTLFAVFQRYVPVEGGADFKDPGLLAMFKLSDGTLLDTVQLLTKNPMSVKVVKGNVYVGTQGEYNSSWGIDADENRGIEKIDLKKKKSELWVSGEKLGGGVNSMEVNAADGKAYVAVYKAYGTVPVVEVDLASKTVKSVGDVMDGSGGLFYDADAKLLYIGDRGFMDWNPPYDMGNMFVHVYDGKTLKAATDEDGFLQSYSITKAGGEIFVYVSDYSSGALYWIEDDDFSSERVQFSSDAVIRNVGGKLIVLDRGGAAEKGNIAEVDPAAKSVSWQKAFETKVNPYDIVAINGSNAWVALYDVAEIRKISLADGSTISSIDTKEFSAKKVEEVTDAE